MSVSETYRVYASDCMALAKTFNDAQARTILLTMAQAWTRLAERVERRRAHAAPAGQGRYASLPRGIDLSAIVFPKGTRRQ